MDSTLFGFWTLSLSLTCVPGLDWAYLISAGLQKRVLPALCGMLLGYLLVILLVAAGLGVVIASYPPLLHLLNWIGAAYLIWIGVQIVRTPATVGETTLSQSLGRKWLFKGIAISGLNPKVLLMFLAIVPQFLTLQSDWSMASQTVLLGVIHILNCLLIYPFVGIGAGIALRHRPTIAKIISRISGLLMIVIAVGMLLEQGIN